LTLNVVRPTSAHNDSKFPVLVYIHGGGFQEGSGADQKYNMSFAW
jgi:triacylglycerol lipase